MGSSAVVTPIATIVDVKPMERPMPAPARSSTDTRPSTAVSTSDIDMRPSCASAMGSDEAGRGSAARRPTEPSSVRRQRAASNSPAAPMPPPMHIVTMA